MKKILSIFIFVLFCSCTQHHFDFKGVELDGTLKTFMHQANKMNWKFDGYIDAIPVYVTTLFGEPVKVTPLIYGDSKYVYGVSITDNKLHYNEYYMDLHKSMVDKFCIPGVIPIYDEVNNMDRTTFQCKSGRIIVLTCQPLETSMGLTNFVYYIDNQNYNDYEKFLKNDK